MNGYRVDEWVNSRMEMKDCAGYKAQVVLVSACLPHKDDGRAKQPQEGQSGTLRISY